MGILIRWAITALGLFVAAWAVPGISRGDDDWGGLIITAAVLGLINVTIKPIIKLFSLPLIAVTLGLFTLVINTICLWLASWISEEFLESDFNVDGLVAAFAGAVIVSLVSLVADRVLPG